MDPIGFPFLFLTGLPAPRPWWRCSPLSRGAVSNSQWRQSLPSSQFPVPSSQLPTQVRKGGPAYGCNKKRSWLVPSRTPSWFWWLFHIPFQPTPPKRNETNLFHFQGHHQSSSSSSASASSLSFSLTLPLSLSPSLPLSLPLQPSYIHQSSFSHLFAFSPLLLSFTLVQQIFQVSSLLSSPLTSMPALPPPVFSPTN